MSNLDLVQIEQLKLISAQLHQTRQEQSRPLEEIAAITYIPVRILRALEGGQVEILPEPVFIQGFIRRYADVLGLDGNRLSKEFPLNAYSPLEPTTPKLGEIVPVKPRSTPVKKVLSKKQSSNSLLPTILGIGVVAGLVYGINVLIQGSPGRSPLAYLSRLTSPSPKVSPDAPVQSPPSASSATTPSAAPAPATASPSSSPTTANTPASPLKVDLNLLGDSWVRIKVDGQTQFEGILKAGEQQSWSATQSLTIRAGNAGFVSLAVNGGTAQPMGPLDDVKEMTITPDTLQPPSSAPQP